MPVSASTRRLMFWGTFLFFGLVLMIGIEIAFASPLAAPSDTPAQTATARRANLSGTATAFRANLSGTATAIRANIGATGTAILQNLDRTATAVRENVSGTATAFRNNVAATATAFRMNVEGTVTALAPVFGGTATAVVSTLQAAAATYQVTRLPGGAAQAALASYGATVLGTNVTITNAAGWTGTVNRNTPVQIANAQRLAAQLAVSTYVGRIQNGGEAFLATSSGAVTTGGNIPVTVQDASFGVWTFPISNRPASADAAFSLLMATYPALSGQNYVPVAVQNGYGFYAYSSATTINPQTGQAQITPQATFLSVIIVGNQSFVSAAVGRGEFATTIRTQ